MTLPYKIRPADMGDFEPMASLWRQLDDFHRSRDPVRFPKSNGDCPRKPDYVRDLIERPDRALLVAETLPLHEDEDSRLVGLCTLVITTKAAGPVFPARVTFEIDNLIVDETMRRRGIARELCRQAEYWSRMHGAGEVILNVYQFNHQARSFYENLGFLPTKTQMARPLL